MKQLENSQNSHKNDFSYADEEKYERARRAQRARRIAEMKRRKQKQELCRRWILRLVPVLFGVILAGTALHLLFPSKEPQTDAPSAETVSPAQEQDSLELLSADSSASSGISPEDTAEDPSKDDAPVIDTTIYHAEETDSTDHFFEAESVESLYGIVIDLESDSILAEQNAYTRISPASMTKILTVLVAAEHISDLDDTFVITQEINDYVFSNDCSAVNFQNDEEVTVRDLLYGTILPSGADAALGLACYVAGSQDAFVELMNDKLASLGLSDSAHFTNCIGLYDDNHYCTMYDMAIIMEAAINNELCREVLSAHKYTTSATSQHPDGIEISNWFLRRIEDKDTHGEVICAKTGYVVQSKSCAASYGTDKNGKGYIIVTGSAHSSWRCIYDHVALYDKYLP